MLPSGLWNAVAGMEREKQIIERRIVLSLAEPTLAEQYGVAPPKAVILFGPPGTGKTSFAKAVASRLDWPFVELFPSRLAVTADKGLATSLRDAFADLAELESVLLLSMRSRRSPAHARVWRTTPGHAVTNELRKLIPGFRENAARLLICATNSVRSLDSAFLRPGRFDYVIPIGPPDPEARAAIWSRYLGTAATVVDLPRLVASSEMFTPAAIEFAARKGAQAAFEREVLNQQGKPATTDDYLAAIADTRPTPTDQAITSFDEDIKLRTVCEPGPTLGCDSHQKDRRLRSGTRRKRVVSVSASQLRVNPFRLGEMPGMRGIRVAGRCAHSRRSPDRRSAGRPSAGRRSAGRRAAGTRAAGTRANQLDRSRLGAMDPRRLRPGVPASRT